MQGISTINTEEILLCIWLFTRVVNRLIEFRISLKNFDRKDKFASELYKEDSPTDPHRANHYLPTSDSSKLAPSDPLAEKGGRG